MTFRHLYRNAPDYHEKQSCPGRLNPKRRSKMHRRPASAREALLMRVVIPFLNMSLFMLALVFSHCAHQMTLVEHYWYRAAPTEAFSGLARVPAADVIPVAEEMIAEASQRLSDAPAIRISRADAADLLGRQIDADDGYVLLRGLCGGCGTGMFYVYTGSDRIIVNHASLASRHVVAKPWPVVVRLSHVPRDVYVQYSIAE